MVKKLQKMAGKKAAPAANGFNPAHLLDGQIAQNVRDSAQQIWAAGLAAFSKTQGCKRRPRTWPSRSSAPWPAR